MPDQFGETLGAPLAGEDEVGHGVHSATPRRAIRATARQPGDRRGARERTIASRHRRMPRPAVVACPRCPPRLESAPLSVAGSFLQVPAARSEEHTSELQSLMRISYAVFCLKKKTTISAQHKTK